MHVERAEKLLYIIYSCDEKPVGIRELGEINQLMEDFTQDVEVLWGLYRDNSLGENVKVAIIASGLDEKEKSNNSTLMEDEKFNRQLETYYGKGTKNASPEPHTSEPKEVEIPADEPVEDSSDNLITEKTEKTSFFQNLKDYLERIVDRINEE